ncbi:MAG: ABC transporter permease [Lachnospiraceae bacterium]|nr:ABC transporter permease [Lachnospiraceae bacterium]
MLHLIKYRIKNIFREKTTLFWSFIFSFILGTLFYMAFNNMYSDLDTIRTALVIEDNSTEATVLKSVLGMISDSEDSLIDVAEMSGKEAEKQLKDGEVIGIFFAGKEPSLTVKENGVEQSVLQAILEQFQSRVALITDVRIEHPEKLKEIGLSMMKTANVSYVKETALGGEVPNGFIQYYFALIAMTCLFGAYMGMDVAVQLQANVGAVGARRCVSATGKMKMLAADILTISVTEFMIDGLLLCYLKFVLKVEIGDDWGKMLLIVLFGSIVGIAIGVLIGSMHKIGMGAKVGILTTVGLFSSFLSGLMIGGIKGTIEEYCPIVNRINPASVITDAFYCITMYPDTTRYFRDILTLGVLAVLLFAVTILKMRRVCYDSI